MSSTMPRRMGLWNRGLRIVTVTLASGLIAAAAAACGYDWTVVPNDPKAKDGSTNTPAKACKASKECPSTEHCEFADRRCGLGGLGECVESSTSCSGSETPETVCTCDGQLSKSRCAASLAGVDLAKEATCTNDIPNTFRCGFLICSIKTFCVERTDSEGGGVDYQCVPWQCPEQACVSSCKETLVKCVQTPTCEALKTGGTIVRCGG